MTLKDVRIALSNTVDSVGFSKKQNCFVAKRTYFHRVQGGGTPEALAARIRTALPQAEILETADVWHAWPKDSYFKVRFTVR